MLIVILILLAIGAIAHFLGFKKWSNLAFSAAGVLVILKVVILLLTALGFISR